jgi:Protein of Unknown function (DUF2784)
MMVYRWLADLVVVVHAMFVAFAVFGGALVPWRPWVAWLHLPAAAWAVLIEYLGWVCPLTPLENALRVRGGTAPYHEGFISHYLLPVLYPAALTRDVRWLLGSIALAMNILIYGIVLRRLRRGRVNRNTG